MLDAYLSFDGLRAIAVLLLAVGQAVMAYWPEWRGWAETVPTRSAKQSVSIVPISWAFAIWGVIYLACGAFSVWQILPDQLENPLLRHIGWLAATAFALNIFWEYHVPKRDIGWGSVAIIVTSLGVLLTTLISLETAEPHDATTFWLVAAPLQFLAGWISAAAFVNMGSALKLSGVNVDRRICMVLMLGAGGLGGGMALLTGALVYSASVAWALFGIIVANRVRDHDGVIAAIAALLIPVVLGAALIGG